MKSYSSMTRWEEARCAEYHACQSPDPRDTNITVVGWWLLGFYYDARHLVLAQICKWKDHDWVSEDWGGPDGGGRAGHCNRCGFSFHHILY